MVPLDEERIRELRKTAVISKRDRVSGLVPGAVVAVELILRNFRVRSVPVALPELPGRHATAHSSSCRMVADLFVCEVVACRS